jgi:broad specificity phosphatase PhoE
VRLLLIRHGQTPSNIAGALDTAFPGAPLTDLGLRQAAEAPAGLDEVRLAGVYSSTLDRARSTAGALATARGLELRVREGLEEIAAGTLEMRSDEEAYTTYRDVVARWIHGELEVAMPGAPDGHAFLARFDDAVRSIVADHDGDATVAVVSHGAAIRVWTGHRGGRPAEEVEHMHLRNTGMAAFEGHPDAGWSLVSWRSDPLGGAHLVDEGAVDPTADQGDDDLVACAPAQSE